MSFLRFSLLLVLLTQVSKAAVCTLTAGILLSTATWSCGHKPTTSDTAVLSTSASFTVDQTWDFGTSPATDLPSLTVNIPLTLGAFDTNIRGGVLVNTHSITLVGGGTISNDASSASPNTIVYTWYWPNFDNGAGFVVNGTSGSHVKYNGNPNGAVGQARFNGRFAFNNVNNWFKTSSTDPGTYIDFTNCGTAVDGCISANYTGGGSAFGFYLDHATFTHSGGILIDTTAAGNSESCTNCVWSGSLGTSNIVNASPLGYTSGEPRSFANTVFDLRLQDGDGGCNGGANMIGSTFTNTYFANSFCGSTSYATAWTMTDAFIRAGAINFTMVFGGDTTNGYLVWDGSNALNPHVMAMAVNRSTTVTGMVFDVPDDTTGDDGETIGENDTSSTVTQAVTNTIMLPTKTGHSSAKLMTTTAAIPPGTNTTINLTHNTWVRGLNTGASFGVVEFNEGGASLGPIASFKNNMSYSKAGSAYYVTGTQSTASLLNNAITTTANNSKDSNATLTITCANCTNQGNSYIGKWGSTRGGTDITTSPNLAQQRNIALWDTLYLGNATGTQWVTSTPYVVGDIVSDPQSTVYGGQVINYRCILAHTSGALTEPNVGANWRNDWEVKGEYDIRTSISAGTTYTDGALMNCNACNPVKALTNWIKQGQVSTNPNLWKAGDDSLDIGAVDVGVLRHIPPSIMLN